MSAKITRLETIRLQRHPQSLWLRIHTNEGLIGLGETSYAPRAVSALIHDELAPLLLGRSPFEIERHWSRMFAAVNAFGYGGAETRAISAVDIALWDIVGQYSGQPICNLLGGRNRERIPIYNTCLSHGPWRDAETWMAGRAAQLAEELLRQGIRAMKIWPFDPSLSAPAGAQSRRDGVPLHRQGHPAARRRLRGGDPRRGRRQNRDRDRRQCPLEPARRRLRSHARSSHTTSCGWRR